MEDFYHDGTEKNLTANPGYLADNGSKSDPTIYLKISSILLVRAGLFLSQVSSIPSSNIQILIFQNIIDLAVNTVVYSLIGFLFAFGKDVGSFIGIDGFLSDKSNRNEFTEGWVIIMAVSGLFIAAVGDRISFFASLVLNFLVSGFVFPMIIHWIMSESGWMRVNAIARVRVSYKDYSYSCLVHMSGGFLAFVSMLILNKRLLRFKDMDVCSIPDNGPSLTLFGHFCMIIGFLGIGMPTQRYLSQHLNFNFYGIVLVNMLLSAFGSVTSTLFLTFACPCEPMHKWTSMRSVQAGISGIAVIAGGADVYEPMAALLVGLSNGSLFFLISFLVNISPIEDYSNIIACHFVSGFLGSLLPPVLGIREGFSSAAYYRFVHFSWQFMCDLAILGIITLTFLPLTFLLDHCSILRSWDEDINHRRALFASKTIKGTSGMSRLFDWKTHEQTVSYLEPGYKSKDKTPHDDALDQTQEKVDILFEKQPSPNFVADENKDSQTATELFISPDSSDKVRDFTKVRFDTEDKYFVNYFLNTRPMRFFEEVPEYQLPSGGDYFDGSSKNPKFFDLKRIKGMKNISDSKLFQKFRDNWSTPKRRAGWSRDRERRFGSMSNIWVPSSLRISLETQV